MPVPMNAMVRPPVRERRFVGEGVYAFGESGDDSDSAFGEHVCAVYGELCAFRGACS